jgi:hypothetical protein
MLNDPTPQEVTVKPRLHPWLAGLAPLVLVIAACGADETTPPAEDHTPVSYTVFIDGVQASPPYTFTEGQTSLVRIRFLNAASEDLDNVEGTHFAGLTFTAGSLASATRLTDHHFQFDVTGGPPGDGTMTVSYGHDELADEVTFPGAAATVLPAGTLSVAPR